ncbi:hypothetical protein Sjap_019135 [Stephania japonica]|uniref:SOUL heme-binding protein n=1 Tax=Stephania japonica TaxID=461633 RepID=A0AAP0HZ24_9MAGN
MATAFYGQAVHPIGATYRRTTAAKPPISSLPRPFLSRNRSSSARAGHRSLKWALGLSLVDRQITSPPDERSAVELVKFLYDDLPHLFDEQGIDRTMYDEKVKFRDPITKHDTISGYLFNIQLLRRLFSPDFQLHSVKQTGPYEITTRWTMVMKFALLPWKPELVFTGISIMGVNPETKKFCSHLDLWDSIKKNDYFSVEGLWEVIRQLRIYKTPDLETPKYRILKRTADYEIREYSPFVVVETKGDKLAGSKGFNDVAGYIFGKNSSEEKIPMTTPVFTQAFDPDRSNISIQIVLPLEKEFDSLPNPSKETVSLRNVDSGIAAALKFSGKPTEERVIEKEKLLRAALLKDGLKPKEGFMLARYNDPGRTWSFIMRNEALMWLEDFKLD